MWGRRPIEWSDERMTTPSAELPALARIRDDVRAMQAYVVADATGYLKMDAMENPFGLPPALQARWGSAWGNSRSTATPVRARTT